MNLPFKLCTFALMLYVLAPAASMAEETPALKPITHEALWMMKRVGAPVASPDGRWVVYSVVEP